MNRRTFRDKLFKLVFCLEFNDKDEMSEQTELFLSLDETDEENAVLLKKYLEDLTGKLSSIDEELNSKITGWTTDRIGKVELAILRLAVYEIENREDVPKEVAINEAVELAKKYGPDSAAGFVNGVLAKFAKEEEDSADSKKND